MPDRQDCGRRSSDPINDAVFDVHDLPDVGSRDFWNKSSGLRVVGQPLNRLEKSSKPNYRAVTIMEAAALKSELGVCDSLVFATACETGDTLLSGNKKHFKEVALLNAIGFKYE